MTAISVIAIIQGKRNTVNVLNKISSQSFFKKHNTNTYFNIPSLIYKFSDNLKVF